MNEYISTSDDHSKRLVDWQEGGGEEMTTSGWVQFIIGQWWGWDRKSS